ncbi:hypothetical protein [Nonomuraea sp. NPDC049480]|uniref:hypothetical protein n=1 Tax=Nonomuraea sp. NPDC049480 TaxID=3364353 RepID=UPI003795A27D
MPTLEHEYLLELVRKRPSLAADLLTEAGVSPSPFEKARMDSGDFTQCTPTEYRADGVIVLEDDHGPVSAIVLEVQRQYDKDKRWSWPLYLAALRARLESPVVLLVFCEDAATARQCAEPIDMGHPGWVLPPVVVGPSKIPLITDRAWAIDQPDLTLVSAITHARADDGPKIAQTLWEAADERPEDLREYVRLMLMLLPDDAVAKLKETLMTMVIEPRNQFMRDMIARWQAEGEAKGKAEGKAEGKAKGEAKSILLVLEARGIPVPDEAKTRITECTDLDILESWVRKAATAASVDELFD